MSTEKKYLIPTTVNERVLSLDVLRGFAVLGILIMNIQSYSMIDAAYINPSAYGDLTGINKWVWILSHLFADQKFMTIFSILFGAGVILFTDRIQAKDLTPVSLHYRRTLWLFIIGMTHAYLLWYGDILVAYAVCAVFVILARNLQPKFLLISGILLIAIPSILYLLFGFSWNFMPPEAQEGITISWISTPEKIQNMLANYRGGWLEQMDQRIPAAISFQTFLFLIYSGWRAGGLMLIGMALYKWGVLSAQRSNTFYLVGSIIGFLIGAPVVIIGVVQNFDANWAVDYSMFLGMQYNYWGSIFIAWAYVCAVILKFKWFKDWAIMKSFAAVGRMALSNYLLQTVICTIIFYGHGFGLYGSVERGIQILIVLCIWILLLILSPIWLSYFHFGPAEWLWRSLTYWKLQPMKINRD